MTVEERRWCGDQFPVGMSVLAVDDDPVCLKLLESLLIRCQYKVTTTGQAVTALRLLRENKNKFDLVISDVHMPDMDGFKLLELVGLEMDLPVIMLSANGEKQAVMKGIAHGACDYLLKPVRIEELKNVWQHVVRRRKFEQKCKVDNDDRNDNLGGGDYGRKVQIDQRPADQSGKFNKKRKDQIEDDEFDSEDEGQDNDDHSMQKKPRVVWTVELHRKFVSAVNQLGIDKAVPRKILDMMNVDKLTRENVASHLQKYRLYLKRLSVVTQQANMASAFGGRNSSYGNMGSLNGFRSYQPLGSSKQLPLFTSFQPTEVVQMNGQSSVGMHGLLPSQTVHLGGMNKNMSYNASDIRKFQNLSFTRNDQSNLLYGVPAVLQLDGSQNPRIMQDVKGHVTNGFQNSGLNAAICTNSSQSGELCNSSPVSAAVSNLNPSKADLQRLSQFTHVYGSNDTGQDAVASTQHSVNSVLKVASSKQEGNSVKLERIGLFASNTTSSLTGEHSNSTVVGPLHGPARSISTQNQLNSLVGGRMNIPTDVGKDPRYANFRVEDNLIQKRNESFDYNAISGTYTGSSFPNLQRNDVSTHYQTTQRSLYDGKVVTNSMNQLASEVALPAQNCIANETDFQVLDMGDAMDTIRLQNALYSSGCSFDDLYAMIKLEQDDDTSVNAEFGSDIYSLGTCI